MKPIKVKIETEVKLSRVWGAILFVILFSLNVAWGAYLDTNTILIISAGAIWCFVWAFFLVYAVGLISDKS